MGIWDTIKKAKNYMTGGGAKLYIDLVEEPRLRQAFKVEVRLDIDDAEIEVDRIYLALRFTEHVQMEISTTDATGKSHSSTERKQNILFKEDIVLDEMLILNADEQYSYETTIKLPPEVLPAFEGVNAKFTWSLQAIIDKAGNNPESKLIYFEPLYSIQ